MPCYAQEAPEDQGHNGGSVKEEEDPTSHEVRSQSELTHI